jgi:hypothetical protein
MKYNRVKIVMLQHLGVLIGMLLNAGAYTLLGQNTGIGTNNPQQKLDVNGNLNVSGNLLLNQTPGVAGQVLTTNGSGNSVWAFPNEFRNVVTYTANNSFTVPSGVSRIMIECWGGGSGATPKRGGGSGGFIRGFFTVSSLQIIELVVGSGGAGGAAGGNSTNGGNSSATVGSITITANGGIASTTSASGLIGSGGTGGGYSVSPSTFRNYIGVNGNAGTGTITKYITNFNGNNWKETYYGNGGSAPEWPALTGGIGEFQVTASGGYLEGVTGSSAVRPGGGGGCNSAFNNPAGAAGIVRIWY